MILKVSCGNCGDCEVESRKSKLLWCATHNTYSVSFYCYRCRTIDINDVNRTLAYELMRNGMVFDVWFAPAMNGLDEPPMNLSRITHQEILSFAKKLQQCDFWEEIFKC